MVLVYTAVASLTVAGPVLYYLGGGEPAKQLMKDIERWLIRNSAALMAVILLVLGTVSSCSRTLGHDRNAAAAL